MNNPFTISFGMLPQQLISRPAQTNEIIDILCADIPSNRTFMITGVRGSGKTVMLTEISEIMKSKENWIVLELNPEKDLLKSLTAKLYYEEKYRQLFQSAKISVSVLGIGFSFENESIEDYEVLAGKMLEVLKKNHKKLLITIDEAVDNPFIREFAHAYQIYIRQNYDISLIMTGLYENIYELQNEKSLTFLYRAPKVMLGPLSYDMIAESYMKVLGVEPSFSVEMAKLTRGYPFAYQVLGYLKWNQASASLKELMPEFDHYLADYVYDKIWHGLTEKEKNVICTIAELGSSSYVKSAQVIEAADIAKNSFSVYRDKLVRKGIVDGSQFGKVKLVLPGFDRYVKKKKLFDDF